MPYSLENTVYWWLWVCHLWFKVSQGYRLCLFWVVWTKQLKCQCIIEEEKGGESGVRGHQVVVGYTDSCLFCCLSALGNVSFFFIAFEERKFDFLQFLKWREDETWAEQSRIKTKAGGEGGRQNGGRVFQWCWQRSGQFDTELSFGMDWNMATLKRERD